MPGIIDPADNRAMKGNPKAKNPPTGRDLPGPTPAPEPRSQLYSGPASIPELEHGPEFRD